MSLSLDQLAHEIDVLKKYNKLYYAGQTYNGVLLDITSSIGGTFEQGIFRPYKTNNGDMFLDFNFTFISAANGVYYYITGITWKSIAPNTLLQPITTWSNTTTANFYPAQAYANQNSNSIFFAQWFVACTMAGFNGHMVQLNSWPTWADA
jgi:hypothetical protein